MRVGVAKGGVSRRERIDRREDTKAQTQPMVVRETLVAGCRRLILVGRLPLSALCVLCVLCGSSSAVLYLISLTAVHANCVSYALLARAEWVRPGGVGL